MVGPLFAALCLGACLLPPDWQALLDYRPGAIDQPWRLIGAHLVHWSPAHALGNAAVLVVACRMLERQLGRVTLALLLLAGALAIDAALWLGAPHMLAYRGASGLVAMLLALLVLTRVCAERRAAAALACIALAGLAALAQAGGVAASTLPEGVQSAWQAHLAGVLAAILALRAGVGRASPSAQDARIMRVTANPALPIRSQP